jgi:hypothetical protein
VYYYSLLSTPRGNPLPRLSSLEILPVCPKTFQNDLHIDIKFEAQCKAKSQEWQNKKLLKKMVKILRETFSIGDKR